MEPESSGILVNMFTLKEPTAEQSLLKRQALGRLEETFALLNEDNFGQYVNFLQEWILNEVEAWAFQSFAAKLQLLYARLKATGRPDLCELLLLINYQLLQQDDPATRQLVLPMTCEMLGSPYGAGYVRNFVKNLLKAPHSHPSYDSALAIFAAFH